MTKMCRALPAGWRTLMRKALEKGDSPDLLEALFVE
jgi:hypothetical protein